MIEKTEETEKKVENSGLVQMKKTTLESVLRAMSFANDEVFLSFDAKGLAGQMVDPAHIGMVKVAVAHEKFRLCSVKGTGLVGFDAKEVLRWLKLVRPLQDVAVQWGLKSLDGSVVFKSFGPHSLRVPSLDTACYDQPKVPKLDVPTIFHIRSSELLQIAKYASKLSHELKFTVIGESLEITCTDGAYRYKSSYQGGSRSNDAEKKVSAKYPSDMVLSFVESLPRKDVLIDARFADDFPVRFETYVEGDVDVTCLLAPRICEDGEGG